MTLQEAFEMYHQFVLSTQKKKSQTTELGRWSRHIAPVCGSLELEAIRSRTLCQLRIALESKKISPQSVYHCLSLVRRVLRRAVEWELYAGPLPIFHMPKFDNRRMRFLSETEAQKLLAVLAGRSELWHDVVAFALQTGLRAGELYALRPFDIDFAASVVKVYDTKNHSGRSVPLNDAALTIAKKYLRQSRAGCPLFHQGGVLPEQSYKVFRGAVAACRFNVGVTDRRERVCLHTMRHTFASWLVQRGTPLALVSKLLGHKSIVMTMRYAHLSPDGAKKAVADLPLLG